MRDDIFTDMLEDDDEPVQPASTERPTPRTARRKNVFKHFSTRIQLADMSEWAEELERESSARAERIEFLIHEVNALQDEIAEQEAENAKLREALKVSMQRAYELGYNRGHNDTVEGAFVVVVNGYESEVFSEEIQDALEDGSLPEAQQALAGKEDA